MIASDERAAGRELRRRLLSLDEREREAFIERLSEDDSIALTYDWLVWARDEQLAPIGDWRFWFIMAGRGFGKTRAGAEWTHDAAHTYDYLSLIGPTLDDVRDIMIEGESGLLATAAPWWRPTWVAHRRRLEWPNGAVARYYTADEPERLRGKQHQAAWIEEPASWRYPEAWDQFLFGFRLPPDPRAIITGTPKPVRIVRELLADPACVVTRGSTYDNLHNLAPHVRATILSRYEGTRLGRQELYAELLDDDEEATILRSWLVQRCRGSAAPPASASPAILGLDVGAGGDDCAAALRTGPAVQLLKRWREPDTMATVEIAEQLANENGVESIHVDVIGVGQGVYDALRRRRSSGSLRARVHAINAGESANESDRFANVRAELWWRGRELSERGEWNLDDLDDDTLDELAAPHYHYKGKRIAIEKKVEVKSRLGRSPDGADAVLLAFAEPSGGGKVRSW